MFKGKNIFDKQNVKRMGKVILCFSVFLAFAFPGFLNFSQSKKTTLIIKPQKKYVERKVEIVNKTEPVLVSTKSFFRWGGESKNRNQDSEKILEILREFSVQKAGKVELGSNESGGRYFHFYIPNQNIKPLELKLKALLGNAFYTEKISDTDKKAKLGNARVVFVLFGSAGVTQTRAVASENKDKSVKREEAKTESKTEKTNEYFFVSPVSENFTPWSEFILSPVVYFSTIHSKDKSSGAAINFYSKQNLGFDGLWVQHLTTKYSTMLGMSARRESWDDGLLLGKTLGNKTYTTSRFFFGGAYHVDESLTFSTAVNLGQESFRRSTKSGTEITFETPTMTSVDIEAKKYFNLKGHYKIGLNLKAFSTLPKSLPNYNIKLSPGLRLGTSIREEYEKNYIEAQLYLEYHKLNTSILEESIFSVGLGLTYGFGTDPNKISPEAKGDP